MYITIDTTIIKPFIQLLGNGFVYKAQAGWSVKVCLCDGLGIDPDYLEQRIQTVFLDGKPVDDVNTETVIDGSRLALSAAMPGLVGATFRKDGYFSAMRIRSTSPHKAGRMSGSTATVTIKLFNLVARELGPGLLQKGADISGRKLSDLLTRQTESFWKSCRSVMIGDREVDCHQLQTTDLCGETIRLRVTGFS